MEDVVDEHQNQLDSLHADRRDHRRSEEPFAFESQIDTDTYPIDLSSKSLDTSLASVVDPENPTGDELPAILALPKTHIRRPQIFSRPSTKDRIDVKKENITPVGHVPVRHSWHLDVFSSRDRKRINQRCRRARRRSIHLDLHRCVKQRWRNYSSRSHRLEREQIEIRLNKSRTHPQTIVSRS